MRVVIAALLLLAAVPATAQVTCFRSGTYTTCDNGTSGIDMGNGVGVYSNGVTSQDMGNGMQSHSNGVTSQDMGKGMTSFSNGRTCMNLGGGIVTCN